MNFKSLLHFAALMCLGTISTLAENNVSSPYGIGTKLSGPRSDAYIRMETSAIKQLGCGFARCFFDWRSIEKKQGEWDFTDQDRIMTALEKQGIEPLAVLFPWTAWAKHSWNHLPQWTEYVRRVATRYKGKVRYWEIWNEQNLFFYWGEKPSAANYVTLLNATYETLKQVDPENVVVLGGLSGVPFDFIEEIYRNGGGKAFDVMNIHPYRWGRSPERYDLAGDIRSVRKIMGKNGDGQKPIWISEIGYAAGKGYELYGQVVKAGLAALDPARKEWKAAFLVDRNYPASNVFDPTNEVFVKAYYYDLLPTGSICQQVTYQEVKNLDPQQYQVLVLPPDLGGPSCVDEIINYIRKGGIVVTLRDVPWGTNNQEALHHRLHIGFKNWQTDKTIPKHNTNVKPVSGFEKFFSLAATVPCRQYFTKDNLREKDQMIPLLTAQDSEKKSLFPAVAYRFDSDLKGGIICSGFVFGNSVSEEQKAQYLPRCMLLAFQAGVEKICWFDLVSDERCPYDNESSYGIIGKTGTPLPAFYAYQTLMSARPAGASAVILSKSTNGSYLAGWRNPDGQQAWAVWNINGNVTVNLRLRGQISKAFDVLGKEVKYQISSENVQVSAGPGIVYLVGPQDVSWR